MREVRAGDPSPEGTAHPVERRRKAPGPATNPARSGSARDEAAARKAEAARVAPTSPATAGGPHSYAERYGDGAPAHAGDGRQVLRPRAGLHRAVTLLLLVMLAAGAVFGYAAWQEPTIASVGIAGTFAAVVLIMWAARASAAPVRVVIDHGVLEVLLRNTPQRFDLRSEYTRVDMAGKPGRPGWEVRLSRSDTPPVVLTGSAVRSRELAAVLRQWRPEL